jgi:hypothetical protein
MTRTPAALARLYLYEVTEDPTVQPAVAMCLKRLVEAVEELERVQEPKQIGGERVPNGRG